MAYYAPPGGAAYMAAPVALAAPVVMTGGGAYGAFGPVFRAFGQNCPIPYKQPGSSTTSTSQSSESTKEPNDDGKRWAPRYRYRFVQNPASPFPAGHPFYALSAIPRTHHTKKDLDKMITNFIIMGPLGEQMLASLGIQVWVKNQRKFARKVIGAGAD